SIYALYYRGALAEDEGNSKFAPPPISGGSTPLEGED
ncbi:unnamed protein product, partial [marine sediment metagenome]